MTIANQYGINLPQIYESALRVKTLKNNLLASSKPQINPNITTESLFPKYVDNAVNNGMKTSEEMEIQHLKESNPNLSDNDIKEIARKNAVNYGKTLRSILTAPPRTRKQYNDLINQYANQLYTIETMPPEEQEGAYQMLRNQVPASERINMPQHYDSVWAKMEIARGTYAFMAQEKLDSFKRRESSQLIQNELAKERIKYNNTLAKQRMQYNDKLLKNRSKYNDELAKERIKLSSYERTKYANAIKQPKQKNISPADDARIRKLWSDEYGMKITDTNKLDKVVDAATLLTEKYMKQGLTLTEAKIKASQDLKQPFPKQKSKYVKDKSGNIYIFNSSSGKYELYKGG